METQAQGGGETHECDICGSTFATAEELQQHRTEQHGDMGGPEQDVPDVDGVIGGEAPDES
jgi:hypothetical protein